MNDYHARQLPQPTVRRYLNLLETSYVLVRLPAYAVNRTKRLIKSPKLYWGDTGMAMRLSESADPTGRRLAGRPDRAERDPRPGTP